jgi:hypothetical protein
VTSSDDPLNIDATAATLLDPQASAEARQAACEAFHATCTTRLPQLDERATQLAAGHALAPADAARCLLDQARTACLVRALDAQLALRVAQDGEARVLYAGCGPLAPLALLLARRWRRRGVIFELVDIHAQSIDAATQLFDLAGAADTLGAVRCADAATLRLDPDAPRPHILIAEVMQRALTREPHVAVVANLFGQCASDAALVPECIAIDAALTNAAQFAAASGRADARVLGRLLTLSSESCPSFADAIEQGAEFLPEMRLTAPDAVDDGLDLMLATRIVAGPGEILRDYESGLTTPLFAFELGRVRAGETLGFRYRLGSDPGFTIRRID